MSELPSVPLKMISVSPPCASIVMLPVEVASVTAASPVVISSAATEPAEPPIPRLAGVIFLRTPPSLTKTKFASPLLVVVVG